MLSLVAAKSGPILVALAGQEQHGPLLGCSMEERLDLLRTFTGITYRSRYAKSHLHTEISSWSHGWLRELELSGPRYAIDHSAHQQLMSEQRETTHALIPPFGI